MQARVEKAEAALEAAQRVAQDTADQSGSSSRLVAQLQQSADKHWQITRAGREEQQQMVKAVRSLLLDAELRVNTETSATHPPRTDTSLNIQQHIGEYGPYGWDAPGASGVVGGGGGSGARRVSEPASSGRSLPSESGDVLSRRRRLLAGSSLTPGSVGSASVSVPDSLALPSSGLLPAASPQKSAIVSQHPSGAMTHRVREPTRSRVPMAGEPYPSLASSGILVPIPQNG